MTVDPATTPHRHVHRGETYFFCSGGCRTKFAADPGKYLDPAAREPAAPMPAGTIFTCPMHPEVRQEGPGSCPICGMALEPEMPTADAGPNPELVDMTRRFWIGLVADRAGRGAGDGRTPVRLASAFAVAIELGATGLRHAGGAVGGLAVLRARRAIDREPQPQHVHADRARHRRGLGLQRRRDACARPVSAGVSRPRRRGRGLFRGGGRHHRAGAARPGAGAARPRADLRRDPRAARSRAEDRASASPIMATRWWRSTRSRSATGCACGPATRCRSTAN